MLETQEQKVVGEYSAPELAEREVSVLDLCLPLVRYRRLILYWSAALVCLTILVMLIRAPRYTAEAKIMPPQQPQSSLTAVLGQLSSLVSLGGKDVGLKSPSDLYIGILKSRTISDDIINKFKLQSYYHASRMSDTRDRLERDTKFDAGKDGLITISVENKNPALAADIANALVDELYNANSRLALTEAAQRRIFFEKQLETEKNALADAEVELKRTQEKTGLIQLSSQAETALRTAAQLKAQLAARQVQLQSVRTYATEDNPDVQRLSNEIAALRGQLATAEKNEQVQTGEALLPTGKLPEAGLEYVRSFRNVKYHEQLYEVLAKQFEAAKIDEGRDAPLVQVVDKAIPPDRKSGLRRSVLLLVAALLGIVLGCIHAWLRAAFRNLQADPEQSAKIAALRRALASKGH